MSAKAKTIKLLWKNICDSYNYFNVITFLKLNKLSNVWKNGLLRTD